MGELRVYWKAFKALLTTKMEYRTDFVLGILTAMAIQFSGLAFLTVILEDTPGLGGWAKEPIILLFGITGMVLGLSELFFNHIWYAPYYVVNGEFDRLLLYPVRSLPFFLITSPELHSFGNFFAGLAMASWSFHALGLPWWAVPLILLWVLCGVFIYTGILTACTSLCFVFVGPDFDLTFVAHHLLMASRYPQGIFPQAVRMGFLILVPYATFNYLPVDWLLHGGSILQAVFYPVLAAAAMTAVAFWAWEAGLSRYESTGT